ncbi:MAG: spore germination protein [Clostridia bacterium]
MEEMGKRRGWCNFFARMRFDRPNAAFELLETEHGQPSFWGGWQENCAGVDSVQQTADDAINRSLAKNRQRLSRELRGEINSDLILRPFVLGGAVPALAAFLNGMADGEQINDFILKPGMRRDCMQNAGEQWAAFALENVFAMQEAELSSSWGTAKEAIEEGRTVVFIEGDISAVLMDTRGFASRSVTTPQNEVVILGPHEAFTENIRTNVTLIRRIIKTDDLVCEFRKSGGKNNNRIAILYRDGLANPSLINEVKRRFAAVDTLMVLSIGTLEQLTEAHPFSPLPQSLTTERPDRVASYLMQGHVAVLCEGSPFSNVMPATLFAIMSSGEDAYLRQPVGTIVRIVRYVGAFLSIIMPAYFLALALHHQGMLSGEVLATVIASRNMVFLPLGVEMLFLLFVFQLVRQAGISVPGAMGQSIGIIGGLILGQAAVSANIVSKVVLIIVALAGLGNFCIPDYNTQLAAAYYRITLAMFAWLGGLLGLSCALLITIAMLSSLKSYGVPFLTPVSPKTYAKGPTVLRGRVEMHLRPTDYINGRRRKP